MKRQFAVRLAMALSLACAGALQATTVVLPSDDQLIEKTPLIVSGRVLDSRPLERDGAIYTETTVHIEDVLKGDHSGSTLIVRELGGDLGDRMSVVFGTPRFEVGESVLLFLAPGPDDAYRVRDMFVGKFGERLAEDGTRLWYRGNEEGVLLLDHQLQPMSLPTVQRRAEAFEDYVVARAGGRSAANPGYEIPNPVLAHPATTSPDRLHANFTLISEPTIYRWSGFDNGTSASWRHVSAQPGYSGGGVTELRAGMGAWTSYSGAKILYQHAGESTSTPGGLDRPNGINEVVFNDVTNEIDGTYSSRSGGVVGVGGFNRVASGGSWTGPFNADASHTARTYSSTAIVEGNLVIQDGVSAANGISSAVLAEIIAHEFGHTLGFGHSEDGTALMYRSVTGRGASLKADDQLAARWLYPAGSGGGTPAVQIPAAPASLEATALDSSRVRLDWNDRATNETSQRVYVAVGSGAFNPVGDVGAGVTTATLTSLNPGGTYRFRVSAINSAGESSPSNIAEITMPGATSPLSAAFSFSPASPAANDLVTFTDGSSGSITTWRWTFGDGTSSSERSPSKRFGSAGTYTVTLTVSNASGSSSTSKPVTVRTAASSVSAAFSWSPSSPVAGAWITFADQSSGSPTSWLWTFGDGTTSSERNPQKRFATAGTYSVSLRAANATSSSTSTRSVPVATSTPATPAVVAAFDSSHTSATLGASVSFTDRSSGSPTSWEWSFGDGNTSTSRNPTHVYTRTGQFTVSLTARNSTSSSVATRTVSISSEPRFLSVLPVAAQTSGAGSTYWRTELSIHNAGARGATVDVRFIPADGGTSQTRNFYVAAGSTASYANALRDLFGIGSGSGALSIDSRDPAGAPELRIASRTFTGSSSGTYGQFVPVEEGGRDVQTMFLTGLGSNASFRTNIGLTNSSSAPVEISVILYNAAGAKLGETVVGLGANAFRQTGLTALFPHLTGQIHPVLSVRLTASRSTTWYGYASVIDNRSQDPVFVRAVPANGREFTIPAVGRTSGAEGTFWRSDVTIYNPTSSAMGLTLEYLPGGRDNSSVASRSESVPARGTLLLGDVLSRFGVGSGSGALRIRANSGTPVVTSRTYTARGDGGTFGQSIDSAAPGDFATHHTVTGLRADREFRTNIGLVNGSSGWTNVSLSLLRTNGSVVKTHSLTLPPRGQTQSALGALFPGVDMNSLGNATVRVVSQGGPVLAYGSVIDNESGDPVFIRGQ